MSDLLRDGGLACAAAAVLAVGGCASDGGRADRGGEGELVRGTAAMEPEEVDVQAMMGAWTDYATPGPEHAAMLDAVGTWDVEMTAWNGGRGPGERSTGRAVVRPVLGGRYFEEDLEVDLSMGDQTMPFSGRSLSGYDNLREEYFYVWADTFMTGVIRGWGEADESGDVITYYTEEGPEPYVGGFKEMKSESRRVSRDRHEFRMWEKDAAGEWVKVMEMVYRRAG